MQSHNTTMQINQNYTTLIEPIHNNNKNIANIPNTHHPSRTQGSTTQACAACRYQRRKCAADCPLAPYFPHDRQPQFLNAHRLFGVSNIVKIIRPLDPPAKDHAMRTIIFQSDARAADPVGGCYRIIRDLEHRISLASAELEIVLHHLALCRAAAAQVAAPPGGREECVVDEDPLGGYDGEYVAEEEVAAPATVVEEFSSSWGFMHEQAHAESTSSSFAYHDNDDQDLGKYSMDGCNDDMKPILDHLSVGGDGEYESEGVFKFDSNGTILSSNNDVFLEQRANFKEDDLCYPCPEDHRDLKAAATFFTLANFDG